VLQVTQAEPPPEPEVAPVAPVEPVLETRTALRGGMRLPTQLPEREETEPAAPPAAATAPTASTAATAPTAPTAPRGVNRAAVVLEQTTPRFPARAKRRDIVEGTVTVEYTIDPKGAVLNPKVVSSEPEDIFDEAALRAISEWKYQPKVEAGVPVASRQRFTFRFSE
jgi:TonB family protein